MRRTLQRECVFLLVVVLLFAACTDGLVDPVVSKHRALIPDGAAAQITAAVQGRTWRGIEDEMLRSEARVSGLGGMFVDSVGNVVVYARDEVAPGSAEAEARALFSRLAIDDVMRASLLQGGVVRRRADHAFSQLVDWQMRLLPRLARVPGYVSIDADESPNRVRIDVSGLASQAQAAAVARSLDVPPEALVFRVAPRVAPIASLRDTFRPTYGGTMISRWDYPSACTLGWNVTTSYNETGFLTASHCAGGSLGGGILGIEIFQNAPNQKVGNITINPPWTDTLPSQCLGLPLCTGADAMFVQNAVGVTSVKAVLRTNAVGTNNNGGSITVRAPMTSVQPPLIAWVGLMADKIGRSTGWTRGTVAGTCEWPLVGDTAQPGPDYVAHCADRITGARGGHGDSGSPVFAGAPDPGAPPWVQQPIWPLGVLFAAGPLGQCPPYPGSPYNCDSSEGFWVAYCTANCTLYYNTWSAMQYALGRFNPRP